VTGSGGGGCMIALCNKKRVDNVMKAISDVGGVPINVVNSDSGILPI
jgi:mevalonate kinase